MIGGKGYPMMKGAGAEPEAEEAGEEGAGPSLGDMGLRRAAKGLLSAIETGDAGAVAKALKSAYEACSG